MPYASRYRLVGGRSWERRFVDEAIRGHRGLRSPDCWMLERLPLGIRWGLAPLRPPARPTPRDLSTFTSHLPGVTDPSTCPWHHDYDREIREGCQGGSGDEGRPTMAHVLKSTDERGNVVIEDPPIARLLFSNTAFSVVWLLARLWLGWMWLDAGLHKVTDPKWVSGGEALKGFWERSL